MESPNRGASDSRTSRKQLAAEFFRMVTSGAVREAYGQYVSADFRHHNAYFEGSREALMVGMEQSEENFPNKTFVIQRQLEDGDFVVTHSLLRLNSHAPAMTAVHIVRFGADDMIVEMWDVVQEVPDDSPNENGAF